MLYTFIIWRLDALLSSNYKYA